MYYDAKLCFCILALLRVYLHDCVFVYLCVCVYIYLCISKCVVSAWELGDYLQRSVGSLPEICAVCGARIVESLMLCALLEVCGMWSNTVDVDERAWSARNWDALDEHAVLGRPGEGVATTWSARNTLFEMWTEANEGVESVLQAEGKRLKRCSQAVATRSRIRSVSFHCAKFLSGEKVPQSRKFAAQSLWHTNYLLPAPLFNQFCPMFCPNLVYEALILVIVFDFVIIKAIMTMVNKMKKSLLS